jgi:hypothetical protein
MIRAIVRRINMLPRVLYRKALVLFVLVLLWGCGPSVVRMYSGSPLPPEKVARLTVYEPIRVYEVDGQEVSLNFGTIELLPGPHTVSVGYLNYFGTGPAGSMTGYAYSFREIKVRFDAKAGRRYRVEHAREGNTWSASIEEEAGQ